MLIFHYQCVRVIRSLEQIIEWRGKPLALRCDNGPEYISQPNPERLDHKTENHLALYSTW